MGQLRKRRAIWWVRYYRNGRRHEESSGSGKKQDAIDLLKIREGDVARGVPLSAKIGQLRFEEAAADLINDYTVNGKRAIEHVQRRIDKGLAPWFGMRRMASLTTSDIRAYVADRQEKGAANATINRELAALKRMFTLAMQAGKLLAKPYIPMLDEDNVRQGFFERAQFEAVRDRLPARLQGVTTVAYYTGWRTRSEILPLKWRQIDRGAGTLRLEPGTTKNRDGRVFKYGEIDELRAVIDAQWAAHEALRKQDVLCPWVFQRNGRQMKSFVKAWQRACRTAGVAGRIPHDFRRTAVRNLIRAGVPDTIAMKMTGHKTRSVFDRYDITSEADLAEASRKLQALVTGTITGTIAGSDVKAPKTRHS
jgi:integrase